MKKLLALTLASILMLSMFYGCTPAEKPKEPTAPTTPNEPTKPQTPSTDGGKVRTDIVIADSQDLKTLDPHAANDGYSARVFNQMYDALLKQGPNLEVLPALAEKYEYKSDTEIVFYITKGVKFHNGDELKASDVKFSIDRMVASPQVSSYFNQISQCDVVDEYTVSVKTKTPFAPLLFNLAGTYGSIVSEKAITEAGDKYNDNPVGTGPMKFKEWKANDHITLVRNDDYFRGTPKATSITIRVIPEDSMRTIALEAGEIDFMQATPSVDVKRVKENDKLKLETFLSQSVNYVGMNTKMAPFDNVKVRQAMNYAINKDTIVQMVLEGEGQAVHTMLAPDMPGANNEINLYPYDVEKAKALLAEAGLANGFKVAIAGSGAASSNACQLMQADLKAINVELDINIMEFGALLDVLNGNEYGMHIISYGAAGNPDSTMSNVFHSKSGSSSGNRCNYANPEADKLIEKARVEMDLAKRNEIYMDVQEMIMQDAPIIPLFVQKNYYALKAGMEGYSISKNAKHDFYNATIKE